MIIEYRLIWGLHDCLKKIQQALTVARQYSESIINSSLDIIVACDKEGYITEFNDAGSKISGYDQNEIIGKGVWELLHSREYADELIKNILLIYPYLLSVFMKRHSY